jgi:TATA-box binding protein (TBP) (component of TFIID and TFIIIB)
MTEIIKTQFHKKRNLVNDVINESIERKKTQIKKEKPLTKLQLKKQKKIIITSSDGVNVKYPAYNTMIASTKTIIAVSNFNINLDAFYKYVPITPYIVIPKKRGRKTKGSNTNLNENIPRGSIISAVNANNILKGVKLKNKKIDETKKGKDFFRHSVSIVIMMDSFKSVNTKVSHHGKFQLTGCKTKQQAIDSVNFIFSYIKRIEELTGEQIITLKTQIEEDENNNLIFGENEPQIIFNTVMKNYDFNLGFKISRDDLDSFINSKDNETGFYSIYEADSNNECNIKHKATEPYHKFLTRIIMSDKMKENEKEIIIDKPFLINELIHRLDYVPFDRFVAFLTEKDKVILEKKIKEKQHTFMAFHSGSIILSGSGKELETLYDKFMKLIILNRYRFEEKLDV